MPDVMVLWLSCLTYMPKDNLSRCAAKLLSVFIAWTFASYYRNQGVTSATTGSSPELSLLGVLGRLWVNSFAGDGEKGQGWAVTAHLVRQAKVFSSS